MCLKGSLSRGKGDIDLKGSMLTVQSQGRRRDIHLKGSLSRGKDFLSQGGGILLVGSPKARRRERIIKQGVAGALELQEF